LEVEGPKDGEIKEKSEEIRQNPVHEQLKIDV
jgi:hypothetical protein